MKAKTKGAISIFLIIIFLSMYVFSGLLVDLGRIEMATTMAESSLDNATNSVLTYYNKYLLDLYGLFAIDASEEKIKEVTQNYLMQTLSLTSNNPSEATNTLIQSIFGESNINYFDGYDFKLESLDVNTDFSLAQTDVTETQVVEYMKYRAPVQLVEGAADGFLNCIKTIVSMTDRFTAIKESKEITKSYKSTIEDGEKILDNITKFFNIALKYCKDPVNMTNDSEEVKYILDYASDFDTKVEKIFEGVPTPSEIANIADQGAYEAAVELRNQAIYKANEVAEEFIAQINQIESNSLSLKDDAEQLKQQIDSYLSKINLYIEELESKYNSGNEEQKAVFGPQLDMVKSSAGEILMHKGAILKLELYFNLSTYSDRDAIDTIPYEIITKYSSDPPDPPEPPEEKILAERLKHNSFLEDVQTKLNYINDDCKDFEGKETKDYKIDKIKVSDDDEGKKEEQEEEKNCFPVLEAKDIEGAVQTKTNSASNLLGEAEKKDSISADTDDIDNILEKGMDIIGNLERMLEGVRDTIYVDEYIMGSFRNYSHHYKMQQEGFIQKDPADRVIAKKLINDKKYEKTINTKAEVEYILWGNNDTYINVLSVEAQITLWRSIFNIAAIYMDGSKIQQATILAGCSGPFAPIALHLILVGWAIAESVIDTVNIMNGQRVLIFKKGADWEISVEGVIKNIVSEATNQLSKVIQNQVSNFMDSFTNQMNLLIYDLYEKTNDSVESALDEYLEASNETIEDYLTNISEQINVDTSKANISSATGSFKDANKDMVNKIKNASTEGITNAKDAILVKFSAGMKEIKKTTNSAIQMGFNELGEIVGDKIQGCMPLNKTSLKKEDSDDGLKIRMGYSDYLRIFLLFVPHEAKMERIQTIVQVNIRKEQKNFTMVKSKVNVRADLAISAKYIFLSAAFVPKETKRDRFIIKVFSNRTY